MQLGMIGLGRMGANMVRRLIKNGHTCVVFDRSPEAVSDLAKEKAVGTNSLADFVKRLDTPRVVWLMVPAAVVDETIKDLNPCLLQETFSLTVGILITWTTSAALRNWRRNASITSTLVRAAVYGDWSEATA